MFHRSIPAREHQQAADLQYFNINSRHPTHIVFSLLLFATIFSDTRNLSLLAAFPGFQRSRPPATTYQVAEDSLQVSVGRRAPGAARARQRHSHKRSKKKRTPSISKIYIQVYGRATKLLHLDIAVLDTRTKIRPLQIDDLVLTPRRARRGACPTLTFPSRTRPNRRRQSLSTNVADQTSIR
jgi:hypothetical protein